MKRVIWNKFAGPSSSAAPGSAGGYVPRGGPFVAVTCNSAIDSGAFSGKQSASTAEHIPRQSRGLPILVAAIVSTLAMMSFGQTLPATTEVSAITTAPSSQPTTAPTTLSTTQTSSTTTQPSVSLTRSSDNSAANHATNTGPRALPDDYAVLLTRSPFMKGHVPIVAGSHNSNSTPSTAPASTQSSVAASGSDRAIVLSGITSADGAMTAMLEDTSAGKVTQAHVGEAAGSGKISAMTLDGLQLVVGNNTRKISLGQNLEGGDAPDVANRASLSTPETNMGGSPGGSTGGSTESVLERMRQKRLREMGGGPPTTAPAPAP